MEVLPIMAEIYDVHFVSNLTEQVSYLLEGIGVHRCLLQYKWADGAWKCGVPFVLIDVGQLNI
jgi:hypothetical protein